MKNNKGMTIIEMLISLIIISLVIALLFNMLIQVRNEDVSNQIQSVFLINQSSFIKEIEEDMLDFGVKNVTTCTLDEANIKNTVIAPGYQDRYKCLKIEYDIDYGEDDTAFLMVYKAYSKFTSKTNGIDESISWVIQYVRGHYERRDINTGNYILDSWKNETQIMKQYPDELSVDETPYMLYTNTLGINAASLIVPIVNSTNEHYDINLSFTFEGRKDICTEKHNSLLRCDQT